jgi:hypothetical protein
MELDRGVGEPAARTGKQLRVRVHPRDGGLWLRKLLSCSMTETRHFAAIAGAGKRTAERLAGPSRGQRSRYEIV